MQEKKMPDNKPMTKLQPHRKFVKHLLRNAVFGFILIALALTAGMWGYHHYEKMPWEDAYVNAAMILSGMGPVSMLHTAGGKIFAGCYALFSGLFFIFILALFFSPLVHRFFKQINIDTDDRRRGST